MEKSIVRKNVFFNTVENKESHQAKFIEKILLKREKRENDWGLKVCVKIVKINMLEMHHIE